MDEWHKDPVRLRMAHLGLLLVLVGLALGAWLAAGTRLRAQPAGSDDAPLAVTQPALSVAKDVTPTNEVPYHGVVTYTVVLGNGGPLSDTNVLLTDTLPAGVDFSRWVAQPPGAEVVADELTWQGAVTAGQALTFTFVVSHVGGYGDVVTNTARFSGTLQAEEDSATFTVVRLEPNLFIAKDVTPTLDVAYHSVVTYSVVLGNSGPLSDTNVLLTDTLPAEVDFDRWVAQPSGAEVVADELTWQGTVTAGQALTFTFVVSHVGDYGDVVTNTARFSGTLQAGEDSATFAVASRVMHTTYLPLAIRNPYCPSRIYFSDSANAIQQTVDGGYVVAGYTESFGACGRSAWVLKLNADGSVAWQKTYGETARDEASAIQQTADGGYIVAGYVESLVDIHKAWVLKLNADGSVAWQKSYGGTLDDSARVIWQTADGGYIVAGETKSFGAGHYDVWVLKLDADGSVAWQKTYGGTNSDSAYAVQQTVDGGYVVAGRTTSFGLGTEYNPDAWVLKLNADGSVAWQKTYGGTDSEYAAAIEQTGDGGYVVAGYTYSFADSWNDAWVFKLDADGNVAWQKTYGGEKMDIAYAIQQTTDDGYVVAGWTDSFGNDVWVLKLNADGSIVWQKAYGGESIARAYAIEQTSDGGYVVAGYMYSFEESYWDHDVWVFKLDAEGDICEGCPLGEDTSVLPVDSNATVTDSSATAEDSDVMPVDSDVEGEDSDAVLEPICTCPSSFCNRFRYVESR